MKKRSLIGSQVHTIKLLTTQVGISLEASPSSLLYLEPLSLTSVVVFQIKETYHLLHQSLSTQGMKVMMKVTPIPGSPVL
jgi:hypothetical protein